jgi:hypothetical protein
VILSSLTWLLAMLVLPPLSVALGDVSAAEATSTPEAMRAPTETRHDSEDGTRMLDGVRATLDAELSSSDRRRLGRKVLSPARVRLVEGTFPGGGTTVVTVNVPLRLADPAAEPRFISGVFTLDDTGTLASVVVAPKMQAQRFDLTALGDTDGDAHDDLLLAVEGGGTVAQRIVTWTDGKPSTRDR